MRYWKWIVALVLLLGGASLGLSRDAWEGPFEKWERGQVARVFNDSPWAQSQTYSTALENQNLGQNEVHYQFTVRLLSALPIRQAYVRMLEIMNHYESMTPDHQKEFDGKVNGLLTVNVSDEVVLTVSYTSNDQQAQRTLSQYFNTQTAETLNQNAYLYSPRQGRLDLLKYFPPGQEGYGARFIYPRMKNGQPILQPGDKELRFDYYIPPINQRLLIGFKPSKMMYNGELSY